MTLAAVPQAPQNLAQTQNAILTNFSTIDAAFSVNHVPYGAVGAGQHNLVDMPVQGSAPTIASGDIGLYNLNNAVTTNNELYIINAAGTAIPMTASASANAGQNGWTYLPSGLLMLWGVSTISSPPGPITVIFTNSIASFPGFGTYASVPQATRINNVSPTASFITIGTFSNTQFTAYSSSSSSGTVKFSWFVIGR